MMRTILNFGAGVNSTALVIEMKNRNMLPDYVIFADTGSEMPKTYEHIKKMEEWFNKNAIEFIIVKSKYECSCYDYFFRKKITPSRKFRDCTYKFKKQPILNWAKQFKNEGILQYIGIGYDEVHRIRKSGTKWIEFQYPLAYWKITREQCIKIIRKEGLNVPVKSGCFMCPFQPEKAWINLLKTHQELFEKAKEMEEKGRRYPEITLPFNHTLKQIETAFKTQKKLTEFGVKDICDGWCMT